MNLERFLGQAAAFTVPDTVIATYWLAAKQAAEAFVAAEDNCVATSLEANRTRAAADAAASAENPDPAQVAELEAVAVAAAAAAMAAPAALGVARRAAAIAEAAFDGEQGRLRAVAAESAGNHRLLAKNGVLFEHTEGEVARLEAADEQQRADDVRELKVAFMAEADRVAQLARGRYITLTEIVIYPIKHGEAARFKAVVDAGGTPQAADFPMTAGEAERRGVALSVVAAEWHELATAWIGIASLIDRARLTAKEAIAAAADVAALKAALAMQHTAYEQLPVPE